MVLPGNELDAQLGALIIPVKGTSARLIHIFRPDTARSLLCSYTDSFPNEIHVTLCISFGKESVYEQSKLLAVSGRKI